MTKIKVNHRLASWFTGTILCEVKHDVYGNHKLTTNQIKYADKEYLNKLYENIQLCYSNGSLTNDLVEIHSKSY